MKATPKYIKYINGLFPSCKIFLFIFILTGLVSFSAYAQGNENDQKEHEEFNPSNFDETSINITNKWMPLKPLTRHVYEGTTVEDGETFAHRVIITVTDFTKEIGGVNCVVTWDLDYSNGELEEAELAFFAQDKFGNVWRMGEYPEEYENGKFIKATCWLHGFNGSIAGIEMNANPKVGMPSYSQGWAPSVDFTDRAQVDQMGIKNCVPLDCFEDVLVIAELSISEPDAQQLKYFAQNVGNIRVGWRGKGELTQEVLELVEIQQLVLGALDEARAGVIKLEKSAYGVSKELYGKTKPIIQRSTN
ncbi:MAG TPA: hypothetical protein VKA26_00300 [Ignavibacteriaceae bacterium]|nr:hypothetical protein [Ignavibacteriaceae bacterium]